MLAAFVYERAVSGNNAFLAGSHWLASLVSPFLVALPLVAQRLLAGYKRSRSSKDFSRSGRVKVGSKTEFRERVGVGR